MRILFVDVFPMHIQLKNKSPLKKMPGSKCRSDLFIFKEFQSECHCNTCQPWFSSKSQDFRALSSLHPWSHLHSLRFPGWSWNWKTKTLRLRSSHQGWTRYSKPPFRYFDLSVPCRCKGMSCSLRNALHWCRSVYFMWSMAKQWGFPGD